jgi:hypothetical protein
MRNFILGLVIGGLIIYFGLPFLTNRADAPEVESQNTTNEEVQSGEGTQIVEENNDDGVGATLWNEFDGEIGI